MRGEAPPVAVRLPQQGGEELALDNGIDAAKASERFPATTLQDLAKLAGCSAATVSRALRDDPRINEQTKGRIWQLAHDYGFPLGKYLDHHRDSGTQIALVIPRLPTRTTSLREPFLLELLAHIGDESRLYGVNLVLHTAAPSNEQQLNDFFHNVGSSAAIVLGQGLLHDALNRIGERRHDFVVWGARLDGQSYCSIGSDNYGGGYKAALQLIQTGRTRLIFVGDILGPEFEQRYNGFTAACEEHGVRHTHAESRLDVDAAALAIERLCHSATDFDGLVCVNDVVAIGCMNTLAKRGMRVPDDVSVIGYDDIEYCRFVRPMLSTVSQNSLRSAKMLLTRALAGNVTQEDSEQLSTDLIVRGT